MESKSILDIIIDNSIKAEAAVLDSSLILDNFFNALREKERDVLVSRFGLKNDQRITLEAIGRQYHLTRERIRQIENSAIAKIKKHAQFSEYAASLKHIVTSLLEEHGGVMEQSYLIDNLSHLSLLAKSDQRLELDVLRNHYDFVLVKLLVDEFEHVRENEHYNNLWKVKFADITHIEEMLAYLLRKLEEIKKNKEAGADITVDLEGLEDPYYIDTELTGRFLKTARVEFNTQTGEPYVSLEFNGEGATLFAAITKANIGKPVAIYLDGQPISQPRVNEEITGGKAQISGGFTAVEAKLLAGRLNSGALPIPIELVASNKVGATLGEGAFDRGITAALYGYLAVIIFLIIWYRGPGVVAAVSLALYAIIVTAFFKFFGVTLTAAGIAGFILSLGMAVDANVLIFERMKEESRKSGSGRTRDLILNESFRRAWTSIRDSNVSSLITAIILFWFGTSLVQGFALVWIIGIVTSLFASLVITKMLIRAVYVGS